MGRSPGVTGGLYLEGGGGGAAAVAAAARARRFRRSAAVCKNAPRANTPRPASAAVSVETTCKRYRPRASRRPPIAAGVVPPSSARKKEGRPETTDSTRKRRSE